MKKIFSYILAFVCAAASVSCVEEEIRQEPQMNLSETEIVLDRKEENIRSFMNL